MSKKEKLRETSQGRKTLKHNKITTYVLEKNDIVEPEQVSSLLYYRFFDFPIFVICLYYGLNK